MDDSSSDYHFLSLPFYVLLLIHHAYTCHKSPLILVFILSASSFFTSLLDCPLLRMVDPRYLNASTFATFVLCNFTVTPALSNSHSCILTFVPLVSSVYHHVSRLFYTCSLFFYRSQCHLQISGIPWPCATRTKMSTFNPKQITPGKQISVGEELAKMGQWLLAIFPCEGKKISNLHVYLLANSIRYK